MADDTNFPELSDFQERVNQTFIFTLEGREETFLGVLTKAEPLRSTPPPGTKRAPFALDFTFPPATNLAQGTFQVRTEDGESFPPMFLVPRGSDDKGCYMDAIFN